MSELRRNLLFLVGCLGVRGSLVVLAKYLPLNYLPFLGVNVWCWIYKWMVI